MRSRAQTRAVLRHDEPTARTRGRASGMSIVQCVRSGMSMARVSSKHNKSVTREHRAYAGREEGEESSSVMLDGS
jgi:hypothetical protein